MEVVIEAASTQKKMFVITVGEESREVAGRNAAVDEAKTHSSRTGRLIHLERRDGCVRMEFRRGRLQSYRYEMRKPSRRS